MKYIGVPKNVESDSELSSISDLLKNFIKLLEDERKFEQIITVKEDGSFKSVELKNDRDEVVSIEGVYENGIIYSFCVEPDYNGIGRYNDFSSGLLIMCDNQEPIFVVSIVDGRKKGKLAIKVNEDIIEELVKKMGFKYDDKEFEKIGETKNPLKKIKLQKRKLLQQKLKLSLIQHREQFKEHLKNIEDNKNKKI